MALAIIGRSPRGCLALPVNLLMVFLALRFECVISMFSTVSSHHVPWLLDKTRQDKTTYFYLRKMTKNNTITKFKAEMEQKNLAAERLQFDLSVF